MPKLQRQQQNLPLSCQRTLKKKLQMNPSTSLDHEKEEAGPTRQCQGRLRLQRQTISIEFDREDQTAD
jgi:hypothetical protein